MLNWYRALRHRAAMPNPRVNAPTLLLWGVAGRFLERGLAEASLRLCHNGRPVWFERRPPHRCTSKRPEAVNKELVEFLS